MSSLVLKLIDLLFYAVPVVICFTVFSIVMLCLKWKTEHRKKHAKRLGVSLLLFPLIACAIYVTTWHVYMPMLRNEHTTQHEAESAIRFSETTLVAIGDQSPDFSVKTLSDDNFATQQLGKVTVVNFFATWCGPCLVELPHLQHLWETHKDDQHFQMIAISREESETEVAELIASNGYTFPVALDTDREIYSQFATESIPRTFVIAPDGTIAYATIGFTDGDERELETILLRLLEGATIDTQDNAN